MIDIKLFGAFGILLPDIQTDRQTNGRTLVIVELLLQLEVELDNL